MSNLKRKAFSRKEAKWNAQALRLGVDWLEQAIDYRLDPPPNAEMLCRIEKVRDFLDELLESPNAEMDAEMSEAAE
jgi:hypothetical protein